MLDDASSRVDVVVVAVVADLVTDELIDAINAMLVEGQWEQVVVGYGIGVHAALVWGSDTGAGARGVGGLD